MQNDAIAKEADSSMMCSRREFKNMLHLQSVPKNALSDLPSISRGLSIQYHMINLVAGECIRMGIDKPLLIDGISESVILGQGHPVL